MRRAHLIALGMSPDEADAALARADEEEEEEADEGEGQRRAWHQRGRSGDDEDEGGGSGSDKEKEKKGSISGGGDSLAARIGGLAKRLNEEAAAGGGEGGRRGTKQQKGLISNRTVATAPHSGSVSLRFCLMHHAHWQGEGRGLGKRLGTTCGVLMCVYGSRTG